ncbi:hypothetical protein C8R46DRAFT_1030604 [Mycena filopes]|nr:hypothetical protein C8R46DRAFT_1030604 [Mycena filopes]
MNIIEHAWEELDHRIHCRTVLPQNRDHLWAALQEEWGNLDMAYINNLYDSLPRRMQALHEAKVDLLLFITSLEGLLIYSGRITFTAAPFRLIFFVSTLETAGYKFHSESLHSQVTDCIKHREITVSHFCRHCTPRQNGQELSSGRDLQECGGWQWEPNKVEAELDNKDVWYVKTVANTAIHEGFGQEMSENGAGQGIKSCSCK